MPPPFGIILLCLRQPALYTTIGVGGGGRRPDAARRPGLPISDRYPRAMARPLYAQVNLSALRANLAQARARAAKTQVLAVVKANAYGHGLTRVVPALADADGLALLEREDAIALRASHYKRRILLLEGFFGSDELPEVAAHRLAVVVHHAEQVRMLERAHLERPLEVFVKINTGMNRLGVRGAEAKALVERLDRDDAAALGLDPDRITYVPLAGLATATEKARRDAPAIAVCEV